MLCINMMQSAVSDVLQKSRTGRISVYITLNKIKQSNIFYSFNAYRSIIRHLIRMTFFNTGLVIAVRYPNPFFLPSLSF